MLKFLGVLCILIILAIAAGAVFFLGGFFNVAASVEDPGVVNWALVQVRQASIARHATDQPPNSINDQASVQAGARAFAARGCTNCHGGPGVEWQKFSEGLNPAPPDLKEAVGDSEPGELFWIVKNGIKMTGIPSFATAGLPDAEMWQIVAFLKKLPNVSEADYKSWTAPAPARNPVTTVPPG
jgi:mono/diheme cytochrome c family protein